MCTSIGPVKRIRNILTIAVRTRSASVKHCGNQSRQRTEFWVSFTKWHATSTMAFTRSSWWTNGLSSDTRSGNEKWKPQGGGCRVLPREVAVEVTHARQRLKPRSNTGAKAHTSPVGGRYD